VRAHTVLIFVNFWLTFSFDLEQCVQYRRPTEYRGIPALSRTLQRLANCAADFDYGKLMQAMRSTSNAQFVCWQLGGIVSIAITGRP
jgi:hypothetical protein